MQCDCCIYAFCFISSLNSIIIIQKNVLYHYSFIPDMSIAPLQVHHYLVLRGARDYSIDTITVSELAHQSATGNCE